MANIFFRHYVFYNIFILEMNVTAKARNQPVLVNRIFKKIEFLLDVSLMFLDIRSNHIKRILCKRLQCMKCNRIRVSF